MASLVPAPPQERSAERRLGASQTAAAIGVHPYARPISEWLVATGRAAPFAGNEATRWGNVLEPVIRAAYVEAHGVTVHVPPTTLFHSDLTWWSATPDGIVVDAELAWQYVAPQVKNVGLRQSSRWEDEPPIEYQVQAIAELAVTGLPRLDFAVLVGGQEYREFTVYRDLEIEASVAEEASAFWRLVEQDIQPAVDGSEAFRSYLMGKIDRAGCVIPATATDLAALERWREVAVEKKQLEEEEDLIKNLVLSTLVANRAARMRSSIGDITIGGAETSTAWKEVATALAPHVPLHVYEQAVAGATKPRDPQINRPQRWTKEK